MTPTGLNHYQRFALAVLIAFTALSCIDPLYPGDQLLQHIPTAALVLLLTLSARRFTLSNSSFTCIMAFMLLHVLGARYVYSFVPYDEWSWRLFGFNINEQLSFSRNHYDRFVHSAFGVLIVRPIDEIVTRCMKPRPGWAPYIAIEFTMASSMLYELGEWLVATTFAPEWADRYVGQQGDMWDAQKDMACATVGAIVSVAVMMLRRRGSMNERASQTLGQ